MPTTLHSVLDAVYMVLAWVLLNVVLTWVLYTWYKRFLSGPKQIAFYVALARLLKTLVFVKYTLKHHGLRYLHPYLEFCFINSTIDSGIRRTRSLAYTSFHEQLA